MRKLSFISLVFTLSLAPNLAGAGPRTIEVQPSAVPPGFET